MRGISARLHRAMTGSTEPTNRCTNSAPTRFLGGLLPKQLTPIAYGSASQSNHPIAFSTSRSAATRRKARLSRRREVNQLLKLFDAFKREEGQTMAEYGVVLAVITIAVFGALALLSGNIVNAITRVAGYIT
jgi:Flp pilus assembly pilin Flp